MRSHQEYGRQPHRRHRDREESSRALGSAKLSFETVHSLFSSNEVILGLEDGSSLASMDIPHVDIARRLLEDSRLGEGR